LNLYTIRFSKEELDKKQKVWEVLCKHFFQRFISSEARILDLASGYCEFINNVECAEKYAIDMDPECLKWAKADVHTIRQSCTDLLNFPDNFFDLVFASNIFEHLKSKDEVESVIRQVRRILTPKGHILILSPNIRYCYKEYWDFFDHRIALSHVSIRETLMKNGFNIVKIVPKFLPYTIKSSLPSARVFVRLYLMLPLLWRIFGKQMLIYGEVSKQERLEKRTCHNLLP